MTLATETESGLPDMKVSIRQLFGIDSDLQVPAYSEPDEHVPDLDPDYRFDKPTTLAILAGFARNRRVIVTGLSRHRQVDPYRAGGGAAQLAVRARQSRQPYQPRRSDRQGCDRASATACR